MTEVDGYLEKWRIFKGYGSNLYHADGLIFSDRKGRFDNGTYITTSAIVDGPDAKNIIRTRNSVYQLVGEGKDER